MPTALLVRAPCRSIFSWSFLVIPRVTGLLFFSVSGRPALGWRSHRSHTHMLHHLYLRHIFAACQQSTAMQQRQFCEKPWGRARGSSDRGGGRRSGGERRGQAWFPLSCTYRRLRRGREGEEGEARTKLSVWCRKGAAEQNPSSVCFNLNPKSTGLLKKSSDCGIFWIFSVACTFVFLQVQSPFTVSQSHTTYCTICHLV